MATPTITELAAARRHREHDLLVALQTARTAIAQASAGLAKMTRALSNMSPDPRQRELGERSAQQLTRDYDGLLKVIDDIIEGD